jgi:hypothetical protein
MIPIFIIVTLAQTYGNETNVPLNVNHIVLVRPRNKGTNYPGSIIETINGPIEVTDTVEELTAKIT